MIRAGPEWVESGCSWVLGRGFEGRLSSPYGVICLLSQKEADMYWLIFTLKGYTEEDSQGIGRIQRGRKSAPGGMV